MLSYVLPISNLPSRLGIAGFEVNQRCLFDGDGDGFGEGVA
jgi:hypothetical protein